MTNTYEKSSEYGGYTVRESKKGWIVEGWSRYQGNITDWKRLVPFGVWDYQRGQDLEARHNEYMAVGHAIQDYARNDGNDNVMVLKKGYIVQ